MSPTSRSLKALRDAGYLAGIVEKFNHHANVRQDLFGFADLIAVAAHRDPQRILIQTTTEPNRSSRLAKMRGLPEVRRCIQAGVSVELWTWRKLAGKWRLRRSTLGVDCVTDAVARPRRGRKAKQTELF